MLDDIELVLFDMAGTTVDDRSAGPSLVLTAVTEAFAEAGLPVELERVRPHRGKEKHEMIRSILLERPDVSEDSIPFLSTSIYNRFVSRLHEGIKHVKEMEGASETFQFLKARGIRVGLGSGFPTEVVQAIVSQFGWRESDLIDYVASAEQVGAGRPDPVMIRDAMRCLQISDPHHVLKVGDTIVDVQEGRNAGARTVGVLSGAGSKEELERAGADFVLASVAQLPELF